MSSIDLVGISKRYPEMPTCAAALRDLSLHVIDGEFLVIAGPSGCGKTTLLRVIAGLERPDAGEVRIAGRSANRLLPHRRDVAMVFQNHALYPHLTVHGNLAFALRMMKTDPHVIAQRVIDTARLLRIDDLLDRKPGTLSGGERQRAALAKALVRQPGCLLLDEPLSNIDAHLRVALRDEITAIHNRFGLTTLHVTHDCDQAMHMADRVLLMRTGRIEQLGTPLELRERPANSFVSEFFSPPSR